MAAIQCDIEPIGTLLLVRMSGELSTSSAPRVRMTLLKCLVEHGRAAAMEGR